MNLLAALAEALAQLTLQFRRQGGKGIAAGDGLGDGDIHDRRQHLLDEGPEAFGTDPRGSRTCQQQERHAGQTDAAAGQGG